jgi:hypothetical protein
MHLSKINEALGHKITSGSEYQWHCYGPAVQFLDYQSEYAHASVIYSAETQEIFQADVCSNDVNKKPYRWLNPDYKDELYIESEERKVDADLAWDDVKWVDLETEEDFLEKAAAIFNGETFDTRIQVPIDLDNDTMLQLAMEAHKRDITLNQMVVEILQQVITEHEFNRT